MAAGSFALDPVSHEKLCTMSSRVSSSHAFIVFNTWLSSGFRAFIVLNTLILHALVLFNA